MPDLPNLASRPEDGAGAVLGVRGATAAGADKPMSATMSAVAARERAAIKRALEEESDAARWSSAERATEGPGWRVVAQPVKPHAELEKLAKRAWDLAFHGTEFPPGWVVRWGSLTAAIGLCVYGEKMILIDERWFQKRSGPELLRTILHELTHVAHLGHYLAHPETMHGAKFTETLQRVSDYMLGEPDGGKKAMSTPSVEPPARESDWELAMVRYPDGRPVDRSAALRSFEKFQEAKRAAGGPAPRDAAGAAMGTTLRATLARQATLVRDLVSGQATETAIARMRERLLRGRATRAAQERAIAERREAEAVSRYAAASESAIQFMQRYRAGFAGNAHPTVAECEGALLAIWFPVGPSLAAKQARFDRLGR
jgi:SprT-like family